jgi:hypothetical protein
MTKCKAKSKSPSKPKLPSGLRPGQHVVARYRGHNGDLIVGRVEEVTATRAVLINLLTGARVQKALDVVTRRNARVAKLAAEAVQIFWATTRDKARTRELAVLLAA